MTSVLTRTAQQGLQTFKGKSRRHAHRFAVQALLRYRTSGSVLNSAWKSSRTLNMSSGGVLIDTTEALPVGTRLELAIDWVGLYHGKPMVRLLVLGSVVRTDRCGTALRILSHQWQTQRGLAAA
jgi:hypothetical protein